MYKTNRISLQAKLLIAFFIGMLFALASFLLLYSISRKLLDDYFTTSSFVIDKEREAMTSLQEYVDENQIPATDSWALRTWANENDITIFSVIRNKVLFYDNSYTGNAPLAETDSLQSYKTWQFFYQVNFADGVADVYIHKNFQKNYYLLAIMISAGISAFLWALFLLVLTSSKVRYLRLLHKEVLLMQQGELKTSFTKKGNDELSDLSDALNQLRNALFESETKRRTQRQEQEALVLGMAHDLRTPLTGLLGFLELCRREAVKVTGPLPQYVDKVISKTSQIRDLSDKLFDFFLSNEELPCVLEAPANAEYLLSDHLSRLCSELATSGFTMDCDRLIWSKAQLQINADFLGRIINNLISNIEKYADKNHPVSLSCQLSQDFFTLQVANRVKHDTEHEIQGTRIGNHNMVRMMQKMSGQAKMETQHGNYIVTLSFPIAVPQTSIESATIFSN
ncbi:MAG: sensor histidine kinase [Lachnospiraceae bacterium]|jgi:signal transduction histidine kinase|nr:sensor histidine kinase [Lachnospiraceae bacterium]